MQNLKSFFLSLLRFIIFSFLGIAIGLGFGIGVVYFKNEGLFTSWHQLDSSMRFNQITNATFLSVWAQTIDGKTYVWHSSCYQEPDHCNQWTEAIEIPSDIPNDSVQPMVKGADCPDTKFQFFRNPPEDLRECAQGSNLGEQFAITYYALLTNGEIWAWKYSNSWSSDIVTVMHFSIGSIAIGMLVFIVYTIRQIRKNKIQTSMKNDF